MPVDNKGDEQQLEPQTNRSANGVRIFRAEQELQANLPFKMYTRNESIGNIWDHTHDYIQIWYVVKGEFKHTINHRSYKMVRGNLFVIPPFAVHRVETIPNQELEVIGCEFLPHFINERFEHAAADSSKDCFDFSYLEQFLTDEEQVTPKVAFTGKADTEVKRLLHEMLDEHREADRFFELVLKANLLKLLSIIIREYTRMAEQDQLNDGQGERVEKYRELMMSAIEYINGHFAEELRLERLCRQFNISKTYFCYLFKIFTGNTFNDYVIDLRVRQAAEWLLATDMTVTEICFGVGFNDLAYFSRMFKRQTGVTPTHFKKNAQTLKMK
ncbi:helix-turn-helix domain-containing protein [Paenibacillus sp. 481]|uniref:helix-turn-helix domain-containing protein n=1 Tax=Paenibacillus sp. 481 TaxID=2835869 RepID=UPI001E2BDC73|nr:AraC family transcriptional regulator [Paenibacillus sp. 481]UHA72125.1 helix-turn-helix transcriptional regulator [Paenibacillus sp. 481]